MEKNLEDRGNLLQPFKVILDMLDVMRCVIVQFFVLQLNVDVFEIWSIALLVPAYFYSTSETRGSIDSLVAWAMSKCFVCVMEIESCKSLHETGCHFLHISDPYN